MSHVSPLQNLQKGKAAICGKTFGGYEFKGQIDFQNVLDHDGFEQAVEFFEFWPEEFFRQNQDH